MRLWVPYLLAASLAIPGFAETDLGRGRPFDILYIHHPPDPVNVRNGNFYLPVQDYYLPCFGFPLEVYRSYNSVSTRNGPMGRGWTFNYDIQIVVNESEGIRVVEADGFVNDYMPVEAQTSDRASDIDKIVAARKKEDVAYTKQAAGKGDAFYATYRKQLQSEPDFFQRQRERYLSGQVKISKSGSYLSHARGTTRLQKTKSGWIRSTETGRIEEYDSRGRLTRLVDRNANQLRFEYDAQSRLSKAMDGCGQSLSFSYNSHDKIQEIKDSLNRKLTYEYDSSDRLLSSVAIDGEKTKFIYDNRHRMTAIVFGDGSKTEIAYNPKNGYVSKQTGPGAKVTQYTYGRDGSTTWAQVTDNEGGKSRYEYIDAENKIIFIDKAGKKTITTVTACCGKPLSIKDEKGVGDEFRYDEKQNLISKVDGQKKVTTFKYEPRFNLLQEIRLADGTTMRFVYDGKGNLSFVTTSQSEYVKLISEDHGKIAQMTDNQDNQILFTYNSFGKPTKIEKRVKNSFVGSIQVTYDKTGEITKVEYEPQKPETVANIKSTLASFLRLLKPSGIDFEI